MFLGVWTFKKPGFLTAQNYLETLHSKSDKLVISFLLRFKKNSSPKGNCFFLNNVY